MSRTICFNVVCLENVLLRHAFSKFQPPVMAADFGTKCLLWRHLATSVTMTSGPFSAFYTQWLSEENCQVSALYLIPVKFGVRFKMAKSPFCPAIAVLELRQHATKV